MSEDPTLHNVSEPHAVYQKFLFDAFCDELDFFLRKKNIIVRILEEGGQEEIFGDELKKMLAKSGRNIQDWGKYEATVNGEKVFIRPGSKKPKGWQITSRGRKPDSFIDCLQKGQGQLLVSRGAVLLIPLSGATSPPPPPVSRGSP